ncbi:hypothetical protein ACS0TY_018759 [Phlomoides rotata]
MDFGIFCYTLFFDIFLYRYLKKFEEKLVYAWYLEYIWYEIFASFMHKVGPLMGGKGRRKKIYNFLNLYLYFF